MIGDMGMGRRRKGHRIANAARILFVYQNGLYFMILAAFANLQTVLSFIDNTNQKFNSGNYSLLTFRISV